MGEVKGDYAAWEDLYRREPAEELPWYYPGLDPDFDAALAGLGLTKGSILDLCTGPGTQAMALAERGYSVTATDIADSAVRQASEEARERGLDITFRQNDILANRIEQSFDLVLDRGCYHLFHRRLRELYPERVSHLVNPGGWLFLKCFSHREKNKDGPYHIPPDEVLELFAPWFDVESIRDTTFTSPVHERTFQALFCVMRRKSSRPGP